MNTNLKKEKHHKEESLLKPLKKEVTMAVVRVEAKVEIPIMDHLMQTMMMKYRNKSFQQLQLKKVVDLKINFHLKHFRDQWIWICISVLVVREVLILRPTPSMQKYAKKSSFRREKCLIVNLIEQYQMNRSKFLLKLKEKHHKHLNRNSKQDQMQ